LQWKNDFLDIRWPFSIKDHLKIQYQNPKDSERLKYCINYTHCQGFGSDGKIEDIFDDVRY
ncbi:7946_t:CDS:1, partial [Funneliformis geosporum]